jgi:hypothetical protein
MHKTWLIDKSAGKQTDDLDADITRKEVGKLKTVAVVKALLDAMNNLIIQFKTVLTSPL